MLRKITSITLGLSLVFATVLQALAVGGNDPITQLQIDCNSSDKRAKFGFKVSELNESQTDKAILFIYELTLTPATGTAQTLVNGLSVVANPQYSLNIIVNEKKVVNGKGVLNITAGFTNELGVKSAEDLLFIIAPAGTAYTAQITSAQIYLLNDSQQRNKYVPGSTPESFTINPGTCNPTTTTAVTTTSTTAAATSTTSTTQTPPGPKPIVITSNKTIQSRNSNPVVIENLNPGDQITLTSSSDEFVQVMADWSQTEGTRILNESESYNPNPTTGTLDGTYSFTLAPASTDVTVKVVYANKNNTTQVRERVVVLKVVQSTHGAATTQALASLLQPPAVTTPPTVSTAAPTSQVAAENGTGSQTGVVTHPAATQLPKAIAQPRQRVTRSLPDSGPKETMIYLVVSSLLILIGYAKLKQYLF